MKKKKKSEYSKEKKMTSLQTPNFKIHTQFLFIKVNGGEKPQIFRF